MCGCRTPSRPATAEILPDWCLHPKQDDSLYLYRVGKSSGHPTAEAAKSAAYQDALAAFSREIVSEVKVDGSTTRLTSELQIRGAEVMPECVYPRQTRGGWSCCVQVSYPKTERNKLVSQINLGEELRRAWAQARSARAQGDFGTLKDLTARIEKDYPAALFPGFDWGETFLFMGDACLQDRNEPLEAWEWYDKVVKLSKSSEWAKQAQERIRRLPEPPDMWRVGQRWGMPKLALLCSLREGQEPKRFMDLTNVMIGKCGEGRLESVDIGKEMTSAEMAAFFDRTDFTAASRVASARGAGMLLAVLYDIDPAKRGTMQEVAGVKIAALDSTVRFFVVPTGATPPLYSGQFKEATGPNSPPRWAERAASILIKKYLVPESPSIGAAAK
jgi:hypothetical protein